MQNIVRTFLICLVMSLLLLLACPKVKAEVVAPTGRDATVSASFDKSEAPGELNIWTKESGGYDSNNDPLWGRNVWTCLSSTDPATGKCSTEVTGVQNGNTTIALLFTEKRSGLTQIINLKGYHNIVTTTGADCWGKGQEWGPYLINAGMQTNCSDGSSNDESTLTVSIPSTELSKLPVGGVWEAHLQLNLMQWSPRMKLADWNAHITLNVTDTNNQQIYLPEFGTAAPHVDLNLRPLPGTTGNQTMLSGTATLDMCLYDGYNANSSEFIISPKDKYGGLPGRVYGLYSVYHNGKIDDANRIDYQLQILNLVSRTFVDLDNWQNYVAKDIADAPLRSVRLPGIPQAVVCVPTALRFVTPQFAIASKTAGSYTGTLHLTLTTEM
ncbi:MAG TPA: CfaE/CblD family pilus tip adhesin [Buttiauxella sp.]|nr:CfaE/CblD family pilus tip adhesin [Buttiauxella sp.]